MTGTLTVEDCLEEAKVHHGPQRQKKRRKKKKNKN
jgi:hypothetical protein